MTEGHGHRRCDLGDNVEGQKHGNGLEVSLDVAQGTACAELVIGDQHEHNQRPGQQGIEIGCGRVHAHHARQGAKRRESHHRGDQRRVAHLQEVLAHILAHHAVDLVDDELRNDLALCAAMHLQTAGQKQAQPYDDRHDDPSVHHRLRDGDAAQYRDFKQHLCAGYGKFLVQGLSLPLSSEAFFASTI